MAPPQRRVQMSLRMVTPSIPENPIELAELKEDEVHRVVGATVGAEER